MSEEEINTHANLVDLTADGGQGVVKGWMEGTKLYVASPGETYFPVISAGFLMGYTNVERINFNNINTSLVQSMASLFYGDSSLLSIDLSNFDISSVTTMQAMFANCSSLTSVDLSMLHAGNITNIASIFVGCTNLTVANLSGLGSDYLTAAYSMFSDCTNINTMMMSGFNFGSASLSGAFSGITSLEILDLSDVDISNVTAMNGMVNNDSNLTTIYVSNTWNVTNVTNSDGLFWGCTSLVGGNGTRYIDKANAAESGDTSYHDITYAVIDTPSTPGYLTLKTN